MPSPLYTVQRQPDGNFLLVVAPGALSHAEEIEVIAALMERYPFRSFTVWRNDPLPELLPARED